MSRKKHTGEEIRVQISVRVSVKKRKELKEEAKQLTRSLNGYLRFIIENRKKPKLLTKEKNNGK